MWTTAPLLIVSANHVAVCSCWLLLCGCLLLGYKYEKPVSFAVITLLRNAILHASSDHCIHSFDIESSVLKVICSDHHRINPRYQYTIITWSLILPVTLSSIKEDRLSLLQVSAHASTGKFYYSCAYSSVLIIIISSSFQCRVLLFYNQLYNLKMSVKSLCSDLDTRLAWIDTEICCLFLRPSLYFWDMIFSVLYMKVWWR